MRIFVNYYPMGSRACQTIAECENFAHAKRIVNEMRETHSGTLKISQRANKAYYNNI